MLGVNMYNNNQFGPKNKQKLKLIIPFFANNGRQTDKRGSKQTPHVNANKILFLFYNIFDIIIFSEQRNKSGDSLHICIFVIFILAASQFRSQFLTHRDL